MSERMWISEQLEQARTERDQARLDLVAKDREIAALRERVAELQADTGYSDSIREVAAEAMRAKCEAIARRSERINKEEFLNTAWGGETLEACANTAEHIANAIAALKDKGEGK